MSLVLIRSNDNFLIKNTLQLLWYDTVLFALNTWKIFFLAKILLITYLLSFNTWQAIICYTAGLVRSSNNVYLLIYLSSGGTLGQQMPKPCVQETLVHYDWCNWFWKARFYLLNNLFHIKFLQVIFYIACTFALMIFNVNINETPISNTCCSNNGLYKFKNKIELIFDDIHLI
jgi:hypothetical protein